MEEIPSSYVHVILKSENNIVSKHGDHFLSISYEALFYDGDDGDDDDDDGDDGDEDDGDDDVGDGDDDDDDGDNDLDDYDDNTV